MNVFHRVAQRSMRANRMRTIVTIIGVILSAAMFTAVTTFATTLLTHLQRVTAYLDGAYYLGVHNVDADTLASMRADSDIEAFSTAEVLGYAEVTVNNSNKPYLYVEAIDSGFSDRMPVHLVEGPEADGKTVFDSNKIFDLGGVKVGVFGLATPETLTKADASKMPGITFPQTDKLYAVAQAQVDELNKAGADLIVCLGHLGIDDESIGNRSIDVCEHVDGIDLFIDGHSHSTTADIIAKVGDTNVVNGAKIVSTGTALANVGVVIYDQETGTLTDELVPAASYTKTDADVAKLVDDRNTAVDKVYGEKIATTEVDLNGSRSGGAATDPVTKAEMTFPEGEGVRTTETNLGDFAADAILWQARQTLGEENVDAALTNGGGIREALAKGDISKKSLLAVFPFGNTVRPSVPPICDSALGFVPSKE